MRAYGIGACLDAKVAAGKLDQKTRDRAARLVKQLERNYAATLGQSDAEAAAAADAARAMKAEAAAARVRRIKQVKAVEQAQRIQQAHPNGPVAGALSIFGRDIRRAPSLPGFVNVENLQRSIYGQAAAKFAKAIEAYRSRGLGFQHDTIGPRNMIRELYGENTGDTLAKDAAKGFSAAADGIADRKIAAGSTLVKREDWRTVQRMVPDRLLAGGIPDGAHVPLGLLPKAARDARLSVARDSFVDYMQQEIRAGHLLIRDFETGGPMTAEDAESLLRDAFDANVTGGLSRINPGQNGRAALYGRDAQHCVFEWRNADAWLRFNDTYGAGQAGIFDTMMGHLRHSSRDAALMEVLGPNPATTARFLADNARKAEALDQPSNYQRLSPWRLVETPAAIDRTYAVLSGAVDRESPDGKLLSTVFGGLRAWQATKAASAILSEAPTDLNTLRIAAQMNGIPAVKAMGTFLKLLANIGDANEQRALALRTGIISSGVGHNLVLNRYGSYVPDNVISKFGDVIMRAQGLNHWIDAMNDAFTLEFLGHVADQVEKPFAKLPEPLRNSFTRYGLDEPAWDIIRSADLVDHDGAKFASPMNVIAHPTANGIAARRAAELLSSVLHQEREFAIVQPTARVRALTTLGTQRGTFLGEMMRSMSMFRSFTTSLAMTHLAAAVADGGGAGPVGMRMVKLLIPATVMGALAVQMKQIVAGKDPLDMKEPVFWGKAFAQGGGLGIFGDLIDSAITRSGQTLTDTAVGPVFGAASDLSQLASGPIGSWYAGHPMKFGARLARFLRYNMLGSNLWYARAAIDRLLMDQIQEMLAPQYRASFARMEQRARSQDNQAYWWRPGQVSPSRTPDISAAAGAQ